MDMNERERKDAMMTKIAAQAPKLIYGVSGEQPLAIDRVVLYSSTHEIQKQSECGLLLQISCGLVSKIPHIENQKNV